MTSIRSLIRLALKKGIKNDFRIIQFVSEHPKCHSNYNLIKEKLNEMIENKEILITNQEKNLLKLQGYPISKDEEKVFVKK